jgi:hypothetical protein
MVERRSVKEEERVHWRAEVKGSQQNSYSRANDDYDIVEFTCQQQVDSKHVKANRRSVAGTTRVWYP